MGHAAVFTVDVIFPCLNEQDALPWVLSRMPSGYRAIVVDNGSTDLSAAVAARHGATVVFEPRRGFGSAPPRPLSPFATRTPRWTRPICR
jgi:hypothetical protein